MKQKTASRKYELRLRNLIFALGKLIQTMDLENLSGRVREIPDERTARFYTTVGLLSPPLRMDGRRALYGRAHLIQLAAIKRLQTQGYGIRDIQELIEDAPASKMLKIARVAAEDIDRSLEEAAQIPESDRGTDSEPNVETAAHIPQTLVQTFRAADGIYITIDPKSAGRSVSDWLHAIRSFIDRREQTIEI